MNDFVFDWGRESRTGIAEAIFCESKSAEQIRSILSSAGHNRLLLTRLNNDQYVELSNSFQDNFDYDSLSKTAVFGPKIQAHPSGVGIVCAGTSDLPVAIEALRTLTFYGYRAAVVADVGVAGLWRLMQRIEEIREFSVVLVVAGMEGALFSVVNGLVNAPVIAIPTSVGYGVSKDGDLALKSALGSCSPGLLTVNIDNGFGGACAAVRILRNQSIQLGDTSEMAPAHRAVG